MLGLKPITDGNELGALCRRIAEGNLAPPPPEVERLLSTTANGATPTVGLPSHLTNAAPLTSGFAVEQKISINVYEAAIRFLLTALDPAQRDGRDSWRDNVLFPITHGVRCFGWPVDEAESLYSEVSGLWGGDTTHNAQQWQAEIAKPGTPGAAKITARTILKLARDHGWNGGDGAQEPNAGIAPEVASPKRESNYQYARGWLMNAPVEFARDTWDVTRALFRESNGQWRRVDDATLRRLRDAMAISGRDPGEVAVHDAVARLADTLPLDDVREMLDAAQAQWDGQQRLYRAGYDLFGVRADRQEELDFALEAIKLLIVAAVRRARHPGCQYDCMVVLEGSQGCGKSSAIRILAEAVGPHRFSDAALLGLRDEKRELEHLKGTWLYECAELTGMRRADTEALKSLITRRVDSARLAYGREVTEAPRRAVLIGTTNDDGYLRDPTGNRRFLPVPVGEIDLAGLRNLREQLWGEAAALEPGYGPLVLSEAAQKVAERFQRERVEPHIWTSLIEKALQPPRHSAISAVQLSVKGMQHDFVTSSDLQTVVAGSMSHEPHKTLPRDAPSQIARVMSTLGWAAHRTMLPDGRRARGYILPCEPPPSLPGPPT